MDSPRDHIGGAPPTDAGSRQAASGTDDFTVRPPSISLPKGGGATRAIGEKFGANPVSGTATFSVPIATSPGRSGFGPKLSVSYDSAAGNGPFGFGWSLALPAITRKTDKGIPRYVDTAESDVYLLSGAEDLVPATRDEDGLVRDRVGPREGPDGMQYWVQRYRPRIEGLFARIERWMEADAAQPNIYWRSISQDNVTTWYGLTANSRIADPAESSRIYSWLICYSHDDKGNAIVYDYAEEDTRQVEVSAAPERGRDPGRAQRYLKRVRYGNRRTNIRADDTTLSFAEVAVSPTANASAGAVGWLFSLVFEYDGEQHLAPLERDANGREFVPTVSTTPTHPWTARKDVFSTYRAGFDVRTYRRCTRTLMFHHFPDELERDDYLVRSTEFSYRYGVEDGAYAVATYLTSVRQRGYRVWIAAGMRQGQYLTRALPPLEFAYTEADVQHVVRDVDAGSLENLPVGVDANEYLWMDIDADGLPGVFTEVQGGEWWFKRNLSAANRVREGDAWRTVPKFGPMQPQSTRPNVSLRSGQAQLVDLDGDGRMDVVQFAAGASAGRFERTEERTWDSEQKFNALPNIDWQHPNLQMVDLNGDGLADVLIAEPETLIWYPSLGRDGFDEPRRLARVLSEDRGPRAMFADRDQAVLFADMSGDGLPDWVVITWNSVRYYPNLGWGSFGPAVSMAGAPAFERQDLFEPRNLRPADIDGSGTTDLFYLGMQGAALFRNLAGNAWSDPEWFPECPPTSARTTVNVVDLLGNGTACLVWSSSSAQDASRPMSYIDLMSGGKPHLLVRSVNNLGMETRVEYLPSTYFYLQDEAEGRPWITRLPFPVHVVHRVITEDLVSRSRFVSRYAYHHGYFDGEEREFRGFGMVEQWDTETLEVLGGVSNADTASNLHAASHVPPVHTKTWFHTGVYLGRDRVSRFFAGDFSGPMRGEYYREPGLTEAQWREQLLDDTSLPGGLSFDEEREACRALKGSMLRQEVFALDGSTREPHPYSVVEQNVTIRRLQSRGTNRHAVFLAHTCEALTYRYERNPADPRVQHALTLEVNRFGQICKQVSIGYGRRSASADLTEPADQAAQRKTWVTYTENDYADLVVASPDEYRTPKLAETRSYELTGYPFKMGRTRYETGDFVEPVVADPADERQQLRVDRDLPYEDRSTTGRERRLIERARTLYRANALDRLLPVRQLESRALPGEAYRLALTPGLIDQVFQRSLADGTLEPLIPDRARLLGGREPGQGGYLDLDGDGNWWIPSGRTYLSPDRGDPPQDELDYARAHFFLPARYRDPFDTDLAPTEAIVAFDDHDVLMQETRDALGNRVTVGARDRNDQRVASGQDYRVLQPVELCDANRNRSQVIHDVLGFVAGSAVLGKLEESLGDDLVGFEPDLEPAIERAALDDPTASPLTILGRASARMVYDIDAYRRSMPGGDPQPTRALTIAREIHVRDAGGSQSAVQLGIAYSDGFEREIQKKQWTSAGPVPLRDGAGVILLDVDGQPQWSADSRDERWLTSGWVVHNNHAKPIRAYESFYSDRSAFEWGARIGVSPVLFYDPLDRVVCTLYPNHTYAKVVFDAWQQQTFDANDTAAPRLPDHTGDPRTDPDVRAFVRAYFAAQAPGWKTWYDARATGGMGPEEQQAANATLVHAGTPTTVHLDSLARVFLSVTQNRWQRDAVLSEETARSRTELDVEGNALAVRDAIEQAGDPLGRVVMRCSYDLLGSRLSQASMDAGRRWMLSDVLGQPLREWDSRGHECGYRYDLLHRPLEKSVRGTTAASDPRTVGRDAVVDRFEYGENDLGATALNLRTRPLRHWDSAGRTEFSGTHPVTGAREAYDFKGNSLRTVQTPLRDPDELADWSQFPQLLGDEFVGAQRHDALNRLAQRVTPYCRQRNAGLQVSQPAYDRSGRLRSMGIWLAEGAEPTQLIDANASPPSKAGVIGIDYDAKGRRERIAYANGVETQYLYDPRSHELTNLYTRRGATFTDDADNPAAPPPRIAAPKRPVSGKKAGLQNLSYTYDAVGNVVRIRDDAQPILYFRNQRVDPSQDFVYDALYRLIEASGREHLGQATNEPLVHSSSDAGRTGITGPGASGRFNPNDRNAMGRYAERYDYDRAGNIVRLEHTRKDGMAQTRWTRTYEYEEASLVEANKFSNRLTRTNVSGIVTGIEEYRHDAHGNLVFMPHLGQGGAITNMSWDYRDRLLSCDLGGGGAISFAYDGSGNRTHQRWTKSTGLREERRYFAGSEWFRSESGGEVLERETRHVTDDATRVALVERRVTDTANTDRAPAQLVRYQIANHLDSAGIEVDEDAELISYEEYSPYGSTTYQAVRSELGTPKRYRYSSKERDEATGLYHFGARYYAAWLGRWTKPDPAGIGPGLNQYAYCSGDPVGRIDSGGSWDINWKSVGKGALVAAAAIVVVGAVVVTAGAAAPAIAGGAATLLGASTATAGAVAAGTSVAVEVTTVALATYGVAQTGKGAVEVATGKELGTGRKLQDDERSEKLGEVAVGVLAIGLGAKARGKGPKAPEFEGNLKPGPPPPKALPSGPPPPKALPPGPPPPKALPPGPPEPLALPPGPPPPKALPTKSVAPEVSSAQAAKGAARHTPDQRALAEIVNEATNGGRKPLSVDDANTVLGWAKEVGYPRARATPGDVASPSHWTGSNPPGQPHIHLPGVGSSGHVPVKPGVTPTD